MVDCRHLAGRLLGSEDSLRRRVFRRIHWTAARPPRDWFDRDKRRLFAAVRPFTMASYARVSNAYRLCREAERRSLEGAFVECGVWKGGTGGVMAWVARGNTRRVTWLFDSFEGLPRPSEKDGVDAPRLSGCLVASPEECERLLYSVLGLDRTRVILRKGWFQESLPAARAEIGRIAVLRVDGDWYESTKVCLETLYESVVPGGYVILDDYNYWEGCRRATDEFVAARGLTVRLRRADHSEVWFEKT